MKTEDTFMGTPSAKAPPRTVGKNPEEGSAQREQKRAPNLWQQRGPKLRGAAAA